MKAVSLYTVEEYAHVSDPPGGRYELRHGELAFVSYPVRWHKDLQRRLREMLEIIARPLGFVVDTDYPYRPLPEHELWAADVACVKQAREPGEEEWLMGSPELVIELKSASQTKHELQDRAMTTLAGAGSVEFWVLDAGAHSLTVYSKAEGVRMYRAPDAVPFAPLSAHIDLGVLFAAQT